MLISKYTCMEGIQKKNVQKGWSLYSQNYNLQIKVEIENICKSIGYSYEYSETNIRKPCKYIQYDTLF